MFERQLARSAGSNHQVPTVPVTVTLLMLYALTVSVSKVGERKRGHNYIHILIAGSLPGVCSGSSKKTRPESSRRSINRARIHPTGGWHRRCLNVASHGSVEDVNTSESDPPKDGKEKTELPRKATKKETDITPQ